MQNPKVKQIKGSKSDKNSGKSSKKLRNIYENTSS